jgi:hypothetical protein
LPRASFGPRQRSLCREPGCPALGKGCWPGPSVRHVRFATLLFGESVTGWLSAKTTTTGAVHGQHLCREFSFAESHAFGKAGLCRVLGFAESLAVGKGSLPRVHPGSRQSVLCRGCGSRQSQTLGKDPVSRSASFLRLDVPISVYKHYICVHWSGTWDAQRSICHMLVPSQAHLRILRLSIRVCVHLRLLSWTYGRACTWLLFYSPLASYE